MATDVLKNALLQHICMKKYTMHRCLTVLTQTVCILALQMPPSGQADLLGLAPGKPGSTVVPVSWLVALKP